MLLRVCCHDVRRPLRRAVLLGCLMLLASACLNPSAGHRTYQAEIRRTAGGIPHIKASDLASLAFGTMYAQAEDNLCILAEQYLSFGARRSMHLGDGDANRESDLFYQFLIDRGDADQPLPPGLEALFEGAAAGYNHYLRTSARSGERDPRCAAAEWLREAEAIDLKRVSRVDYALAYMRPIIAAAAPPIPGAGRAPATGRAPAAGKAPAAGRAPGAAIAPAAGITPEAKRAPSADRTPEVGTTHASRPDMSAAATTELGPSQIASLARAYLEVSRHGGSNGVAIGREASLHGGGLLLANPHMPWNEPFQRFYPMHQTIPGEFDVIGANLIGRPRVGFGHTANVAWTSTVSQAKRMTFYRLELDPEDPTVYRFDGDWFPMQRHTVTIDVRNDQGELETVSHTYYETHFGALLVESPFFAWTSESAFAVRLLDAGWRGETSVLDQYAAKSVRELKAVHDREQFLPVNLIAADRTGEVLYADPGPIPNLPDELMAMCAVLQGAAIDGSRSECQWRNSDDAAAPGIFPPAELPSLFRTDYVTNSNDSYWLANPAAPLEAHAKSIGTHRTARTLRTRSGLEMITREIEARGGVSLDALRTLALSNENQAGQLIRDDVVLFCRETPQFSLADGRVVSLADACRVLAEWDLHANLESRGAMLFRQLLAAANAGAYTRELPQSFTPAVGFDPAAPVETPRGLSRSAKPVVLANLAKAVAALAAAGIPLDASLGNFQSVTRNGLRIPLHGGPEFEGIFNKIESDFEGAAGYADVDRWSSSWILAVEFGERGPQTFGILTYSLSANPESPHFADQTRMFSKKQWLALPFREDDVEAAAERSYFVRSDFVRSDS